MQFNQKSNISGGGQFQQRNNQQHSNGQQPRSNQPSQSRPHGDGQHHQVSHSAHQLNNEQRPQQSNSAYNQQQPKPAHSLSQERPQQKSNNSQQHQSGNGQQVRKFQNVKSHGSKAAFEIAPDETMKGWHTIRLEGAPTKGDASKAFNWDEKVSIQVTKTELPIVIGVLLGYLPMCEFKNHGGESAKWFYMENQGKNFFFKIGQGTPKRMSVCPIPTVEAYLMGTLALTQHVKNFDGLDTSTALASLKTMCAHLVKSGQYVVKPQAQGGEHQKNNNSTDYNNGSQR